MARWCWLHAIVGAGAVALAASCVPADEALPLGSAQFTVTGRGSPRTLSTDVVIDQWSIHVDRFLLSFKTMTIVNLEDSEQCAYRGRGARTNVVFDGVEGSLVQAFNGIKPGACPDVGMRLGAPDDRTVPGEGATAADIVALASGRPAHAIFEATALRKARPPFTTEDETLRVSLRFDSERTASSFGGCRDAIRGARINPEARYAKFVHVAAEAFFRDAISSSAQLRFAPYVDADRSGNNDGVATMDELEELRLFNVGGQFYQLPNGSRAGTFADYVRAQFMFAVKFGEGGLCNGLEPGTEDEP
jgi:hypothetical protein